MSSVNASNGVMLRLTNQGQTVRKRVNISTVTFAFFPAWIRILVLSLEHFLFLGSMACTKGIHHFCLFTKFKLIKPCKMMVIINCTGIVYWKFPVLFPFGSKASKVGNCTSYLCIHDMLNACLIINLNPTSGFSPAFFPIKIDSVHTHYDKGASNSVHGNKNRENNCWNFWEFQCKINCISGCDWWSCSYCASKHNCGKWICSCHWQSEKTVAVVTVINVLFTKKKP